MITDADITDAMLAHDKEYDLWTLYQPGHNMYTATRHPDVVPGEDISQYKTKVLRFDNADTAKFARRHAAMGAALRSLQ